MLRRNEFGLICSLSSKLPVAPSATEPPLGTVEAMSGVGCTPAVRRLPNENRQLSGVNGGFSKTDGQVCAHKSQWGKPGAVVRREPGDLRSGHSLCVGAILS